MKRTRVLLMLLIALSLLAACNKDEPPVEELLRPVRYALIVAETGTRQRSFSGVSVAATETKLSFRVSGSLQALRVKVGDQLEAGDLIATLDDRDLQLKYEEAKAAVLNAKVQASSAKSNLDRVRDLYEKNNVALSEYEQAKNGYAAASADYSARQKQLDLQYRQLQYGRLVAPMAGIVTDVPVALNENINAGEIIAVLSSSEEIEINVGIPEAYITSIESGNPVSVQFSALNKQSLSGVVTEVSYTATGSSTFPVTIRLNQTDARLRPGMAADVSFSFASQGSAALKVPASAVAEDQTGKYVYLLKETDQPKVAIVERQSVMVGELTQQGFAVRDGLQAGDAVVTSGVSKISVGMRVRLDQTFSGN